jgi:sulfotransferase family protein
MGTVTAGRPAQDDDPALVFVVGCPRSGTTWLQLLLAQHPGVATANETRAFFYVDALRQQWRLELARPARRPHGLPELLTADDFDALCRDFAAGVLTKIRLRRPGARVILEKTPAHLHFWESVLALFPEAHFLHLIRDPRGVVSSILHAARTPWGAPWASRRLPGAIAQWRSAIEAGRHLAQATQRYREVRYEALLRDGPSELAAVLAWLGLRVDDGLAERAVTACRIGTLRSGTADIVAPWPIEREPEGFFRRGELESWRAELTAWQVGCIEARVGDLMTTLGYALATPRALGPMARWWCRGRDALAARLSCLRR